MRDRFVRGGFVTLAVIGALILLASITIEVVGVVRSTTFELPHKVYLIGMLFGFVGFYGLDHKGAVEGTTFIVDIAGRVILLLRAGRRKTDPTIPVVVDPKTVEQLTDGARVESTAVVTKRDGDSGS